MKKTLIAVAAAAALATSSAFAEITFGAWLRVLAAPIASDGDEVRAGMTNSWGWGARSSRLDFAGTAEDGNAGFVGQVFIDAGGDIAAGDHYFLWVKPVDMLKVSVGKYDSPDNGLRGDFCYGSWNWLRPYNWGYDGEGLTFDGIWRKGLMLELDPVEGLHIFAVVPMETGNNGTGEWKTAENVYRNAQVGFGYSIEGIGRIKAQWIGDWTYTEDADGDPDEDKTTGQFGVAFDLTAVENLYVTIGGRFGIADKDYRADYVKAAVTAGVSYQVTEEFKVSVDGGFKMFQDDAIGKAGDLDDKLFFVGAGIDYALMDGLTATADVRFMNTGYGKDGDDNSISFMVGINKSVSSNGSLGIAFQGATNGCGFSNNALAGYVDAPATKSDEFVWAIPVSVSVWF